MAVHDSADILSTSASIQNDLELPRHNPYLTWLASGSAFAGASFSLPSVFTNIRGDFSIAAVMSGEGGPSGGAAVTLSLQDAPNSADVLDANANWFTLDTFSTALSGSTLQTVMRVTGSHFGRMRVTGTTNLAGESGSLWIIAEGVQLR